MTVDVRWYIPQHVALVKAEGFTTIEEYMAMSRALNTLFHDSLPPTYVISNETDLGYYAPNVLSLRESSSDVGFQWLSHKNLAGVLVCGDHRCANRVDFVFSMLRQSCAFDYRRFASFRTLMDHLRHIEPNLRL
jgi:hypothetical protein